MPIQGFTRLRRHLFGRQSAFGNVEPGIRAYPFSGTPDVDLQWTDPEGDFGSFDPVAAPYRGAPELGASLTAPVLTYNDLTAMVCAFFGGNETPTGSGTAKTWTHTPASTSADDFDVFSYEFGDDVEDDWYQFRDGILSDLELSGQDQGPLNASMTWIFSHVASTGSTDSPVEGSVPGAAVVDAHAIPIYLKDMSLYLDSAAANIGDTQILDAIHGIKLSLSQDVDKKRMSNGTQEFEITGYGRGARRMELELTLAKTADTVGTGSESDAWMSDEAVDRFARLAFVSTAMAQTAGSPDVPYSWQVDIPLRYYTRTEGEAGGNTTIILTGHAFFEADTLDFALESTLVNTLAAADFAS